MLFRSEWGDLKMHRFGFDLTYSWDSYSRLKAVWKGASAASFLPRELDDMRAMPPGGRRLRFTTNHDETAWDSPPVALFGGAAGARAAYVPAVGLFVGALLAKTVTCTLPVVLLLILWWKRGRVDVVPLLPFFALGAAAGVMTGWMEAHHVGAAGELWRLSLVERCLIAGRALWFYAAKLLWPHPLAFIYARWRIDAGVWWQYLFPIAAVVAVAALYVWRRRLGDGPLVAVLCYAATLAPALGFVNVYPMRYSFVADHFQYLPSVPQIGRAHV